MVWVAAAVCGVGCVLWYWLTFLGICGYLVVWRSAGFVDSGLWGGFSWLGLWVWLPCFVRLLWG